MTFDVASVRQSPPYDPVRGVRVSGGFQPPNSSNLRLENNDVPNLLSWAYGTNYSEVQGVPKDLQFGVFFSIDAKSDATADEKLAALPKEELRAEQQHMLQVFLAERFKLKAHWETRQGVTYDLVVSKPGRLQSTGAPPSPEELKRFGNRPIPPLYQKGSSMSGFEYIAHGASTTDIAGTLALQFGHPVTDRTQLRGKYDFDLKYYETRIEDRKESEANPWPPLETAIQDQLGLRLVKTTGPNRVFIVDHIEKPSEN
jgi:uncharacterized protein (TIGR03435 family)